MQTNNCYSMWKKLQNRKIRASRRRVLMMPPPSKLFRQKMGKVLLSFNVSLKKKKKKKVEICWNWKEKRSSWSNEELQQKSLSSGSAFLPCWEKKGEAEGAGALQGCAGRGFAQISAWEKAGEAPCFLPGNTDLVLAALLPNKPLHSPCWKTELLQSAVAASRATPPGSEQCTVRDHPLQQCCSPPVIAVRQRGGGNSVLGRFLYENWREYPM